MQREIGQKRAGKNCEHVETILSVMHFYATKDNHAKKESVNNIM
jgi:hypothetical protein